MAGGRIFVPARLAYRIVRQQHEATRVGDTALDTLLKPYFLIPRLPTLSAHQSLYAVCSAPKTTQSKGPPGQREYSYADCSLRRLRSGLYRAWAQQGV